jgi:polysaccharide export outer membrane protein
MFRIHRILWLLILVAFLASMTVVALGQAQSPRTDPRRPSQERTNISNDSGSRNSGRSGPDVILSADEDYKLAPSDVIKIYIEDAPELSFNFRINKAGTIPMKYLGTTLVAGKTTEEVSALIADGLRDRYLKDPKVYVTVEQYNSRTFFIQGAVRNPGVYIIEGRPSLFKLISVAGGLSGGNGSTAYIIRESKVDVEKLEKKRAGIDPGQDQSKAADSTATTPVGKALEDAKASQAGVEGETEYEVITAQIGGLYRGRFEQNLVIQPNDFVYIPPSDVFFVAGEVKAPGQYTLRDGTTLRQAISLAQGTFFRSATNRAVIFRQDPVTGKLTEVMVDIGAVMSGKKDDIPILPNDVIVVPNSKVKAVAGGVLMTLGNSLVARAILGR